jgi:hypothetical protein
MGPNSAASGRRSEHAVQIGARKHTKGRQEASFREAIGWVVGRRVGAIGVVEWCQSRREAEPKCTKRAEDDKGKRVADEELLSLAFHVCALGQDMTRSSRLGHS